MGHVHVAQRRIVLYICRLEMNHAVRRSERNRAVRRSERNCAVRRSERNRTCFDQ